MNNLRQELGKKRNGKPYQRHISIHFTQRGCFRLKKREPSIEFIEYFQLSKAH